MDNLCGGNSLIIKKVVAILVSQLLHCLLVGILAVLCLTLYDGYILDRTAGVMVENGDNDLHGINALRHRSQFLAALVDFSGDALFLLNLLILPALAVCCLFRYDSLLALLWCISKGGIAIDEG